ncbi:MAG: hypothetical protein V4812_22410 [Pseudomonadota bacterium]
MSVACEASSRPQARTLITTWQPTLNLRTTVSELTRTATCHYDTQGCSTGQTVTER